MASLENSVQRGDGAECLCVRRVVKLQLVPTVCALLRERHAKLSSAQPTSYFNHEVLKRMTLL